MPHGNIAPMEKRFKWFIAIAGLPLIGVTPFLWWWSPPPVARLPADPGLGV